MKIGIKSEFNEILIKSNVPFVKKKESLYYINDLPCLVFSSNSSSKQKPPFSYFSWSIPNRYIEELTNPYVRIILIGGRNFQKNEIDIIINEPEFNDFKELLTTKKFSPIIDCLFIIDMNWIKRYVKQEEESFEKYFMKRTNVKVDSKLSEFSIQGERIPIDTSVSESLTSLNINDHQRNALISELKNLKPEIHYSNSISKVAMRLNDRYSISRRIRKSKPKSIVNELFDKLPKVEITAKDIKEKQYRIQDEMELVVIFDDTNHEMVKLKDIITKLNVSEFNKRLNSLSTDKKYTLARKRIESLANFKINIFGKGLIDQNKALNEIEKKTKVGKLLVELEMNTIKSVFENIFSD